MRTLLLIVAAQNLVAQAPTRQTESDAYTRYELLAPGSAKFRIIYEVTATTPGATYYFNPIRKGSVATDESVLDRATGKPLVFDVVGAREARAGGVNSRDTTQTYIRVKLTRPVPPDGGEARVLILKTYEDTSSYFTRGDTIVFTRPLGIKRNAVVLPLNYELVASTFPSQVLQEADRRVGISFWNSTPSEAAVTLRAVPVKSLAASKFAGGDRLDERAHQNREIVYFLQQPQTHAFDLYHDFTETRAGTTAYLNVVRAGSKASNPHAVNLDTGEPIAHDILRGDAIIKAKLDVKDVTSETEVVVFRFPAVQPGASMRLRMFETYTDSARYRVVNDELIWDRSFGRPTNIVVLPAGWMLTNSAVPATVTTRPDGRVQLEFINGRNDDIPVLITARRRVP
jgi:hypothetical protein